MDGRRAARKEAFHFSPRVGGPRMPSNGIPIVVLSCHALYVANGPTCPPIVARPPAPVLKPIKRTFGDEKFHTMQNSQSLSYNGRLGFVSYPRRYC